MPSSSMKIKNGAEILSGNFTLGGVVGSFILPTGTTAQRPSSPVLGHIRANSTTGRVEFYEASGWRNPIRRDGDVMTGALTLSGAPTDSLHATTKAYVDGKFAEVGGISVEGKLNRGGDTMTGFLSLHADPSIAAHAATKRYVDEEVEALAATAASESQNAFDTAVAAQSSANSATSAANLRVLKAGDTMTGTLIAPNFSLNANAFFSTTSSNPVLQFDSNDFLVFDQSGNSLALAIGSSNKIVINSTTMTLTVAPIWASDPSSADHLSRKSYVDATAGAAPVSKTSLGSNTWSGTFALLEADTEFFTIAIPSGTRRILGSSFCAATNTATTLASAIFDVVLRNSGGTQVSRITHAIARSQSTSALYGQTGGTFSFTIAPGASGYYLQFVARKDQSVGPFNLLNLSAHALFITD